VRLSPRRRRPNFDPAEPNVDIYRRPEDANALPFALRTGGDGPSETHLVCGFFSCDARPFNPLLNSLPRFMRASRATSQGSHSLLEQFIRFATAETGNKRAGSQSVLNRLSELMFVEVIRLHMNQLANNNTGWLAGLRDPLVGRALTLLHARHAMLTRAKPQQECGDVGLSHRLTHGAKSICRARAGSNSIRRMGWSAGRTSFGSRSRAIPPKRRR